MVLVAVGSATPVSLERVAMASPPRVLLLEVLEEVLVLLESTQPKRSRKREIA